MAKEPKTRPSKPSERKSSKKEAAPAQFDQGSEESKFRPRLRDMYEQQVVPALMKEFGYKNVIVDSFSMVSLKVFLDRKYAIRIPDEEATPLAFDTVTRIAELVTHIREAVPKAAVP